jgi:VanZ family protein
MTAPVGLAQQRSATVASPRLLYRLRSIALAIYLATLAILLTLPGYKLPKQSKFFSDKWEHGAAFMLMGVLMWRWLAAWREPLPRWARGVVACIAAAAFGALLEFAQLYVPRRTFDWYDIAWNALGGLVAGSIAFWPAILRARIGGEPMVATDNDRASAG